VADYQWWCFRNGMKQRESRSLNDYFVAALRLCVKLASSNERPRKGAKPQSRRKRLFLGSAFLLAVRNSL
jgi:hypothetical protein